MEIKIFTVRFHTHRHASTRLYSASVNWLCSHDRGGFEKGHGTRRAHRGANYYFKKARLQVSPPVLLVDVLFLKQSWLYKHRFGVRGVILRGWAEPQPLPQCRAPNSEMAGASLEGHVKGCGIRADSAQLLQSCPTRIPWTTACQAPLSMEYWGGVAISFLQTPIVLVLN